ncbi:MAG: type II toxin-antitoxin system RelE/ParE family toxin [Nitrospirota bacterium]
MPYTVLLRPAAERDLKKLPPEVRSRIKDVLLSLEQDPLPPGVTKLTDSSNLWRIRCGDYRILFEIDDTARTVLVLRIAHRREAYR